MLLLKQITSSELQGLYISLTLNDYPCTVERGVKGRWGAKGHFLDLRLHKYYRPYISCIVLFIEMRFSAFDRALCGVCRSLSNNLIANTKLSLNTPPVP